MAYDGSWYALRRDVESLLSGDAPPKLVVYAPGTSLADDPLEEIRAAGVRFTIKLATLVKNALKGELSEQRLAEIGGQARTLAEAEAAVGGDAAGDVRLIGILGASDARTMALRILTGERAESLDDHGAWSAAAELLVRQIGGALAGEWDDLRRAALRQMALTEIATATGGLPDSLIPAWGAVDAEQRRRTAELLQAWQTYPGWREDYGAVAHLVDDDLALTTTLPWADGLAGCTATPALEEVAFGEAVEMLANDVDGGRRNPRRAPPQGQSLGPTARAGGRRVGIHRCTMACGEGHSGSPDGYRLRPGTGALVGGGPLELVRRARLGSRPSASSVGDRSKRSPGPR